MTAAHTTVRDLTPLILGLDSMTPVEKASPDKTSKKLPAMETASPAPANSSRPQGLRKLIKIKEVLAKIRYSRTQLYAFIAVGKFPKPIHLGGKASFWIEAEVIAWLEGRIEAERTSSKK